MLTAQRCSVPLALAVSLALAGCTAADGGADRPSAASASAVPRSTAAEGFPVFAVDDIQEARLRLPGGPDWMAIDEDGVWVKRDNGLLDRIDPDTGKSALHAELGSSLCQGVGVGLGAVWACQETDVVRIDAASGEVTATFRLNKTATQGHLVTAGGRLWVLTGDGGTLLGVDPETGAPVTTIPLGARGTDLNVGPAGLWVASQLDGQALRIDPDAGTVVVRATGLDRPLAVAVTDQVWVGGAGSTVRIDPANGSVMTTSPIGIGLDGGITASGADVWVRSAERFLVRLDASTGAPVSGMSADVESAGDIVVAFGSVWTTAYDDATLFRLPAS